MTLTQRKRKARPAHYARKDARKRIYRELYGIQGELQGRKTNHPATDETRRFDTFWSYQNAVHVFETNVDIAQFTLAERGLLVRRLDSLRNYKQRSKEMAEIATIIDAVVSILK